MASNHIKTKNIAAASVYTCVYMSSSWTVVREVLRSYAMYVASGAQQCTEMLSCNLPRQVAEGKSAAGGRYSKTKHTYIAGYYAECTVTMASNHVQAAINTINIAAGSVYTVYA